MSLEELVREFVRLVDTRDLIGALRLLKPMDYDKRKRIYLHTPPDKMYHYFELLDDKRLASMFNDLSSHRAARVLLRQTPLEENAERVLRRLPPRIARHVRHWMGVERGVITHVSKRGRYTDALERELGKLAACRRGGGVPRRCEAPVVKLLAKLKKDSAYSAIRDLRDDTFLTLFQAFTVKSIVGLLERFGRLWQHNLFCRFQQVSALAMNSFFGQVQRAKRGEFVRKVQAMMRRKKCPAAAAMPGTAPAQQPSQQPLLLTQGPESVPAVAAQSMALVPYRQPVVPS